MVRGSRAGSRQQFLGRAVLGGVLAGLANLVPGLSGGTMLLAAGIYPEAIAAIARVSTLRPDRASVSLLVTLALSAGAVILMAAGWVRDQVATHRWVAYSIFLGATLGGAPLLWRMIGARSRRTWTGATAGILLMLLVALAPAERGAGGGDSAPALFVVGLAAFAATLLPGLSGGYVLVVSGQYLKVLGAVDNVKDAFLSSGGIAWAELIDAAVVLVPFAAGMLAALIGMSSLIRYLLKSQESFMLGFLLGLLLGAVPGLWPFAGQAAGFGVPDWSKGAGSVALVTAGFLATFAISRFESRRAPESR